MFDLENSIVKLNIDHEKVIGEKEKQLDDPNKSMVTLRKGNGTVKKDQELLKEEKSKLNHELGKIQYDKDTDAEVKSEEKLRKLFYDIIQKHLDDGKYI